MKILLYSDLHISRTSSIMPVNINNDIYSYRQKMIIDLGKYLAELADMKKVDLIINLGDTFDQHTVTSYDIEAASEFFKNFRLLNIPHLVIVGNHEMLNNDFNAIALVNNINNITVIDKPCTIDTNTILLDKPNVKLAFLPYCDYKDILIYPEGDFLFSHQDIQGSVIRGNFELPEGINPQDLKSKYKLVFNGHIHKSSIKGNIVNVGSTTTHSFSDDNEDVPKCYIFDTDTLDLQIYKPNMCPLFRKFEIQHDIIELNSFLNKLDINYKYILHIICPFELKDAVKDILNNNEIILNHRVSTKITKQPDLYESDKNEDINLQSNVDIKQSFIQFLDNIELKYPKEEYIKVLSEVK